MKKTSLLVLIAIIFLLGGFVTGMFIPTQKKTINLELTSTPIPSLHNIGQEMTASTPTNDRKILINDQYGFSIIGNDYDGSILFEWSPDQSELTSIPTENDNFLLKVFSKNETTDIRTAIRTMVIPQNNQNCLIEPYQPSWLDNNSRTEVYAIRYDTTSDEYQRRYTELNCLAGERDFLKKTTECVNLELTMGLEKCGDYLKSGWQGYFIYQPDQKQNQFYFISNWVEGQIDPQSITTTN